MINSVNTLEFLKPKLITMDKFSSATNATKFLPPSSPSSYSPTRSFVTFGSHIINHNKTIIDLNKQQQQQQQQINGEIYNQEERVKVQHVENHTKLQNNKCWNNFRTLCNNLSASSGIQIDNDKEHLTKPHDDVIDVVNMEQSGMVKAEIPITNIQTKSAFNLDLNKVKYHNNSIYINNSNNGLIRTEMNDNNNDQFSLKQYHQNNCDIKRKQQTPDIAKIIVERRVAIAPRRTEDQNNAYRHIESVHNYAKLKSYEDDDNDNQSPHGSRHSSYLDDEEDDEEEDDEEDNDEVDKEYDNGDYDERLEMSNEEYPDVLYANYENIINRQQRRRLQKLSTSSDGALFTKIHNSSRAEACAQKPTQLMQPFTVANSKMLKSSNEDEEAHIDVDVETVETHSAIIPVAMPNSLNIAHQIADDSNVAVKPDHHARRPMNAFLIFCKRHRAIVKERYKNLENRAITKILGDWWASLDENDKKCFTNLAQQNKDAFFSANPNFKWYKLPAPPLRTLTTRPAIGQDYQEEKDVNVLETISNNTRSISHNSNSNYFKLADEAQMGDLSQLMEDKSKTTKQCADLQQALGETSQFMSAHITGTAETLEENSLKRRFYNENSFSSNSSEEDNMEPKKKSARSCKGKRYQELINSGQIVTAIKKSKSSTRLSGANDAAANSEMNLKQNFTNLNNNDNNFANNNICQKRSVSESDNILSYDLNGFDLEERIKELPALDLDEYLQRKRNTKKKKKFSASGKKRGQRNNNNTNDVNNKNNNKSLQATQQMRNASHKNTTTAVGSQKRKARKESITRRDISAIEQEVASLLPLTINGCCYFQETPTTSKYMQSIEKDSNSTTSLDVNLSSEETSSTIIPLQSPTSDDNLINNTNTNTINNNKNNSNNSNNINDNTSSSTSDLLILAEVAANRTELKR